jgi:hypothetical protein
MPDTPDPLVIFFELQTPAAHTLADIEHVEGFKPEPLRSVLERIHNGDVFFALYSCPDERFPRLAKSILSEMDAAGQPPTVSVSTLDWDTENHEEFSDPDFERFRRDLAAADLPQPTYLYRTRSGARLVFVHDPLHPHEAEDVHRGLEKLYGDKGIVTDAVVHDWTRLNRCPNVTRDGAQLRAAVYTGPRLDLSGIPRIKAPRVAPDYTTLCLAMPNPEEAKALVWKQTAREPLTDWGKRAAKECESLVFDRDQTTGASLFNKSMPPKITGKRNATISHWLGYLVWRLARVDGATPAHVFGLVLPAVEQAVDPSDPGRGRCLVGETWKMIKRFWANDRSKAEGEILDRRDAVEKLLATMRDNWPTDPGLTAETLAKHAILRTGAGFLVLRSDGYYNPYLIRDRGELIVDLQQSGLPDLGIVSLTVENQRGSRPIRPEEILSRYVTRKHGEVITRYGKANTAYFDGEDVIRSGFGLRRDIEPKKYAEIEDYFFALLDNDEAKINRVYHGWFALMANFDFPMCALFLCAPPGSGKQLIARGIASITDTGVFANGEVFCDWQYRMNKTPFIVVNEAFPAKAKDPDVKIRQLIGGDDFDMKTKYNHPEGVCTNPRILFTANNPGMYQQLFAGCKTEDDRRAVSRRVLFMPLGNGGAQWLDKHGHRKVTDSWIKEHKLAQHFLWLHQKHGQIVENSTRLLMEGPIDPDFVSSVQANPRLTALAETLWRMIEGDTNKGDIRHTERGWPATKASLVKRAAKDGDFSRRDELGSEAWIGRALRQFRSGAERLSIDNVHDLYEIDIVKLIAFAEANDLPCPKMKAMAAKKEEVACGLSTHSGS